MEGEGGGKQEGGGREGVRSARRIQKEDKQNLQKSLMGPSGWQQKETI